MMASQEINLNKLDDQIGFRLRLALQVQSEIFSKTMQFGLTQAQFVTLARLQEVGGPCSQNQLGRLVALDSASILGVVSRLKARDFVRTERNSEDKRRVMVELTPKGSAVTQEALGFNLTSNEAMLSKLSKQDQIKLIRLLKALAPTPDYAE